MARAERLLRLIQLLRKQRRPVTAAALADELEVSVRSVYRDVDALRAQGASIEGAAGTGYLLRPGFLLPPLMFDDDELDAIVLGLRLVAEHADAELGRSAEEVAAKLRAVLPRDLRRVIDESALLVGPAREKPRSAVALSEVRRALRVQAKAEITYVREHERSARVVWPLGLGFFERAHVLIAWCELRADFRSFRLDRIVDFRVLAERYPDARTGLLRRWREREQIPEQLPR